MKILHTFRHGLGDVIQFLCVIRTLKHYYPGVHQEVSTRDGYHSAFFGQVEKLHVNNRPSVRGFDLVFNHKWHHNEQAGQPLPATKTVRAIQDLGFEARPELLTYRMNVSPVMRKEARTILAEQFPAFKANATDQQKHDFGKGLAIIHATGNTLRELKDLPDDDLFRICHGLCERGFTPLVIDQDNRHKELFADNYQVKKAHVDKDAEAIGALLECAKVVICCDSGIQKVALAVGAPTICCWTKLHPIHYCDISTNSVHLIPENHAEYIAGDRDNALEYFNLAYTHTVYQDLAASVLQEVDAIVDSEDSRFNYGMADCFLAKPQPNLDAQPIAVDALKMQVS